MAKLQSGAMVMGQEDVLSDKLERVLGKLLVYDDLVVRIDDHGIYWGSRYQRWEEQFITFTRLEETPFTCIMELFRASISSR